ncbi:2-hydroxyacyl-CoA dehydratase [Chloroflexota bacterium]
MNLFEAEIANFERRIKKITENPDKSRMYSNKMLYEIWLDYRKQQLKAWQDGKPFVYFAADIPRLFRAIGLEIIHPNRTGDRAYFRAKTYLDLARNMGFPSNACDRIVIQAAIAISGDIPPPAFCVNYSGGCGNAMLASMAIARHFNVPYFTIDHPRENTYESVNYVLGQLYDMIRLIEETVPGSRFDEKTLVRLQERDKKIEELRDQSLEIRKARPSPIGGRDALRLPPIEIDDPRLLEYTKFAGRELEERVKKKVGALSEEKLRVYWLVTAPFFTDIFAYLASKGAATPLYEAGAGTHFHRTLGDDTQYSRHLSPLEEEAADLLTRTWSGPTEWRVDEILTRCRQFDIDALVHCQQPGCVTCAGSWRVVADQAEQELGIPSLYLDLACQDVDRYNQKEIEAKINDFIDMCLVNKRASNKQGRGK